MEQAKLCCLADVKSPKSNAFPVVWMVTNSIELVFAGSTKPAAKIPLVGLEQAARLFLLAEIRSPKSCAFPVDAMVTNSMALVSAGETNPDANSPRVEFEQDEKKVLATVKSPKSCAFPVVEIVINYQNLVHLLLMQLLHNQLYLQLMKDHHHQPMYL